MTKEQVIEKTISTLNKLPVERGEEIADFADFILQKFENDSLQKGIQQLIANSATFSFLNDEEDIYTINDLKEKYL